MGRLGFDSFFVAGSLVLVKSAALNLFSLPTVCIPQNGYLNVGGKINKPVCGITGNF
jgi:hypothetical protein